jgi:hypothetical protein
MRELAASFYWAIVGALISFGGLALMSIGLPFLVAGCGLAIVGLFTLELGGAWAITPGFGGIPMAVLLRDVIGALASPDPSCTGRKVLRAFLPMREQALASRARRRSPAATWP